MFIIFTTTTSFYKFIYIKDVIFEYYFTFFNVPYITSVIVLINIFYITLYTNKFPYFEKLKANNLPWPWEEDWEKFKNHLPKVIATYIFNDFFLMPIYINIFFKFFEVRFDIESLPSFGEFWFYTWASFLVEDFFFYWVHRAIHHPKLYWIHKKHHEFYNTFHLACVYTHPIEYLAGVAFPLLSGTMIF